ncbi:hypothetical protein K443DRAFT_15986 [Laccaria amethystina LaAM-08-1]|uniref:Uncharacterized protein n=1 Tax=Laccaria amethystina LaAM-08-1 TaxID=1095629 RepID=A0A0C9WPQ0_9AGAR|nr:hypothetical protein K443DRAFT_15986 [Laccaria amethystina LaAM-08-1]
MAEPTHIRNLGLLEAIYVKEKPLALEGYEDLIHVLPLDRRMVSFPLGDRDPAESNS